MRGFPLSFYFYLLFIWEFCISATSMSHVDELQRALPRVQTPIIANGPMGFGIAGGDLAAAVTRAGGLGQVGFISNRTEMERQLDIAKSQLEGVIFNNTNSDTLPIGMGVNVFGQNTSYWVPMIAKYRPAVVWLSFGTADEYSEWTSAVPQGSPQSLVWIQVGTVSAALAASSCQPDAIVLQGADAGGHGVEHGASIISLIPETADALGAQGASNITLVAAGGIADGRGAVAALALGASAVVMGTRFLGAYETNIPTNVREAILEARDGGQATVRSKIFDEMWGSNSWPQIYDGGCLRNAAYDNIANGMSLAEVQQLFQQTLECFETEHVDARDINSVFSGTGVGMVQKEEKAADIMRRVQQDTKQRLQNMIK